MDQLNDTLSVLIANNNSVNPVIDPTKIVFNQPKRSIEIQDLHSCDCGGTHIKSLLEIGSMKIKKIKNSSNTFRISFVIDKG
jgi:Ser-tRNA(Ala) deacylase AlaX